MRVKVCLNNLYIINNYLILDCGTSTGLHIPDTHGGAFTVPDSCPLPLMRLFIPWWPTYIIRKRPMTLKTFTFLQKGCCKANPAIAKKAVKPIELLPRV